MRRLVNLIEYMMKTNVKDENERAMVMEELYREPEELSTPSEGIPSKKKRRSGKEKLANYVNKHNSGQAEQNKESSNVPTKSQKKPKGIPPPGVGMSLAEAKRMLESVKAEDREFTRG